MMRSVDLITRLLVLIVFAVPSSSFAFPYSTIYVLGDSLSDQGNLFTATRSVVGPANALPASDHYFDGRFSNGPVYTDLLAQQLGIPLLPSIVFDKVDPNAPQNKFANNFAYGGARTTYNRVEQFPLGGPFPNGLFPWSLNAQVLDFGSRGVQDPNALYIVFSGANDVADILAAGMNAPTVINTTVSGIASAVEAFAAAGARTVLAPNIPDLGLTPVFGPVGSGASMLASLRSAQFNAALAQKLNELDAALPLNIIQFQTDDLFTKLVSNPASFGLDPTTFNVSAPCYDGFVAPNPAGLECSNPEDFLFWDVVHPTTVVHSILANAILAEVIPEPSTLPLFLAGVLVLGVLILRSPVHIRPS